MRATLKSIVDLSLSRMEWEVCCSSVGVIVAVKAAVALKEVEPEQTCSHSSPTPQIFACIPSLVKPSQPLQHSQLSYRSFEKAGPQGA